MGSHAVLLQFLILLAVSIPITFLFQKLKVPAIIGFLVTGIIVGPSGLALVSEHESVQTIAELGVVLLLFTIGVEFSLGEFFGSGRRLILAGLGQVLLAITLSSVIARLFHLSLQLGIFLGFLICLSSTAVVLKIFADRAELSAPHGRASTVILLLQDLCVVPMMLLIPSLSGGAVDLLNVARQIAIAVATLAVLFFASRYLVPLLLKQVVQSRSRDLFLVTVVCICLGTAAASAAMGLSLAIGAFIAGLVISESDYSHQILSEILPFRDIFNAIFFISVGMLVEVPFFVQHWQWNLLGAVVTVLGKSAILFAVLMISGLPFRASLITALSLSQIGEFSFLLAEQGRGSGLLSAEMHQWFLAVTVITMALTPLAISIAIPLSMRMQRWLKTVEPEAKDAVARKEHLLIIGYGLNGQNLSRVVREAGLAFLVVELNDRLVQSARKDGIPVLFGDATRREVLIQADAKTARMAVIAISDPAATRHCLAMLRSLNPAMLILVRTRYVSEVESLVGLGANVVIPEEFETSIEIFARVLKEYNIPDYLIEQQIAIIRSDGYGMLRGLSLTHERMLQVSELLLRSTVEQLVLGAKSPAKDRTIRELDLRKETGVSVIAVIRADESFPNPDGDFTLRENDILVLWGAHRQLADARTKLT